MISFENITATYDGRHNVVEHVSLTIARPAITGIIGPNGAGKSTFIKAALNLIPATGEVTFDGAPLKKVQRSIAYVEQKSAVDYTFPITVKECVALGLYPKMRLFQRMRTADWQKVDEALALVKMTEFAERQIGELSGGQFQRILIARTLIQDAQLIFLDEPFVGIDATSEQIIMDVLHHLREAGKYIFIVHHDLGKVKNYFDELILLNHRLIAAGPTAEVFVASNLKAAFGDAVVIEGGDI